MMIAPTPANLKDIVLGQDYRLRKDGDVIKAYPLPTTDPNASYRTIPDNAVVTVLDTTTKNGDVWLRIHYKNFTGAYYVQADLIDDITATVEVKAAVVPKPDPESLPANMDKQDVPPAPAPKTYDELYTEKLEALYKILGELIDLRKSHLHKETAHV